MITKRNRIEFLYPENTSERYKKWIENARLPLIATIKDYDIISLTFEEYLHLISYNEQTDGTLENVHKYDYNPWKCGEKNFKFLNLNSIIIKKMNQKIIHEIATYLFKNPLLLTKFLEFHAISIMDSLLQISKCTPSPAYFETLCQEYFDRYLTENYRNINEPTLSEALYKQRNFESKYLLSIYLGILNELLDLGVNVHEAKFTTIDFNSHYSDLMQNEFWNATLLDPFKKLASTHPIEFKRCDGVALSIENFIESFSFTDVNSFLEKVKFITQFEAYHYYIEEPLMVKPECIDPIVLKQYYNSNDFSSFSKEEFVHVNDLCDSIQEKVLKKNFETKKNILMRKINQVSNHTIYAFFTEERISIILKNEEVYEKIVDMLDSYIEKMRSHKENERTQSLDFIINTIEELIQSLSLENTNNEEKQFMKINLLKEIDKLNHRLDDQEKKIEDLLKQVENYLVKGTPLKMEELRGLNTETIKKLLNKKPIEKPSNYYMRRILLWGMLLQLGFCNIFLITKSLFKETSDSKKDVTDQKEVSSDFDPIPFPKFINFNFDSLDNKISPSLEENLNLILNLGNYFENPGRIPYYTSIYDTNPAGYTNKSGIIVGYYAFKMNGDTKEYVASLKNIYQIEEFIANHLEECANYTWKVALYTATNENEILEIIQNKTAVPYHYFSYFVDFDIKPFLDQQHSLNKIVKP
ncbi:MAG: hypothetical protein HFJ02_01730 [Bacilli bacterium]|nr:hypothetical protein [Bacilli bacterium]